MMEDDKDAPKAAQVWATWLTPSEAIKLLSHLDERTARLAIFQRLKHGLIQAIARKYSSTMTTGEYGHTGHDPGHSWTTV